MELLDKRIPIAAVNTIDKALSDPQILSRNMVVEINYGSDKKLKILGNPLKMSEIAERVRLLRRQCIFTVKRLPISRLLLLLA
mgnify:CR=1 FL=1